MVTITEELIETEPCRYGVMSFLKNDTTVSRSLKQYGEWAQAEIEFLTGLLGQMDTVVDIGAFIGTHTIAFARTIKQSGNVYAFEPQPLFFELLSKNVRQNGLSNVSVFPAAISDSTGSFHVAGTPGDQAVNFGGTSLLGATTDTIADPSSEIINVKTLDSVGLDRCDLVKVDVEGMELNVLRGARKTLGKTRPVVFLECHSLHYGWPLIELARAEGYQPFLLNVPAFNPNNFRLNQENFFQDASETGLVLIPRERARLLLHRLDKVPHHTCLIPISRLDDLALGLLKKPQYKHEVLSNTEASRVLGVDFWANESEVRHFEQVIRDKQAEIGSRLEAQQVLASELETSHRIHEQAVRELQRNHEQVVGDLQRNHEHISQILRAEQQELRGKLDRVAQQLHSSNAVLQEIYQSHGWRALSAYYRLRDSLRQGIRRLLSLPRRGKQGIRILQEMRTIAASGLFNSSWYLSENPDVAQAGVNPLRHYVARGAFEGRDPNPLFDSDWYLRKNTDVKKAGINPLCHYLRNGASEGRDPSPRFDSDWYLRAYPDVSKANRNPLAHYLQTGIKQGYEPRPHAEIDRPLLLTPRPLPYPGSAPQPKPQVKRRLICLSHVLPYPPRAGNEYRIYRMLDWFGKRGFEIFPIICPLPNDPISEERLTAALTCYANLILCHRDGTVLYRLAGDDASLRSLKGFRIRDFGKLLLEEQNDALNTNKLLEIVRIFCPDVLAEVLLKIDSALQPEVVLADYAFMTRALPLIGPHTLKIVDTIDVFSTKHDKVIAFGIDDRLALRPEQEASLLARADIVLAIQPGEAKELRRLLPNKPVITAGVDFDFVDSMPRPNEKPIVLLVASNNLMNVKGVADFLRFAWPLVKRDVPGAELQVIGSVGQAVDSADPAVQVLGQVEDLHAAYAEARVVINPAVAGTGLKVKTVEALCHLRPIVVWPSGVDGLLPELSDLCRVATNWYDFARHVSDLCTKWEAAEAIINKRDTIREEFSADAVYKELGAAVDRFRPASQ